MASGSNTRVAMKLAAVAFAMFGFGYLLVPVYNVFCDITGLNGKTGELSAQEANTLGVVEDRIITVTFDTNINGGLPWEFKPRQREVTVHPGEVREVMFYAKNKTDKAIVGQAVPSVAPAKASVYFNKTECFCFTQQTLEPNEGRDMPVRFVIDPNLPDGVSTVTLSYTFFQAPEQVVRSTTTKKEHSS